MLISNEIIDALVSQAQQDAPNETCGYLLGISTDEGDVVTENYWMENIDSRQLAQSSCLALASFAGRPPSGQRPHHPLCHPLSPRGHSFEFLQDSEW